MSVTAGRRTVTPLRVLAWLVALGALMPLRAGLLPLLDPAQPRISGFRRAGLAAELVGNLDDLTAVTSTPAGAPDVLRPRVWFDFLVIAAYWALFCGLALRMSGIAAGTRRRPLAYAAIVLTTAAALADVGENILQLRLLHGLATASAAPTDAHALWWFGHAKWQLFFLALVALAPRVWSAGGWWRLTGAAFGVGGLVGASGAFGSPSTLELGYDVALVGLVAAGIAALLSRAGLEARSPCAQLPPESAAFVHHLSHGVYDAELAYIRDRRRCYRVGDGVGTLPQAGSRTVPSQAHGTIGVALSGGGIRSATFSLGVLQALARLDILRYVDYLSTVSGGGYIGACVTSLLSADPAAGVEPAGRSSRPFPLGFEGADRERDEVRHLRDYSNYISPHHGPFKRETWRLIGWYVASVALNLVAPLALGLFVLLVATRVVLWAAETPAWWGIQILYWLVIATLAAFLGSAIFTLLGRDKADRDRTARSVARYAAYSMAGLAQVGCFLAYPMLLVALLRAQPVAPDALLRSFAAGGMCTGSTGTELDRCQTLGFSFDQLIEAVRRAGVHVGTGLESTKLFVDALRHEGILPGDASVADDAASKEKTPRQRLSECVATLLHGEACDPGIGRLLAPMRAPLPGVLRALGHAGVTVSAGGGWLFGLLPTALATIVPGLIAYRRRSLVLFAGTLAGVFGLILGTHALWWLDHQLMFAFGMFPWPTYGTLAAIGLVAGLININAVSMLNFYRDRLADCYIIRRDRSRPIVTNDALTLAGTMPAANGPYPLINATLNLSGSNDLSLRGRMADHFLFSREFTGSPRLGYRRTKQWDGGDFDLATAMAISGAAVSPQSGAITRPGLAVLMALFNLRLGRWVLNPREARSWPVVFWTGYFAKELFSQADENDKYVLLSDGGHFENTGMYALLQRHCRVVIAVDAGCDPERRFDDVAGMIRKARIDFGVDIDIDLRGMHGTDGATRATAGFALGIIHYPEGDGLLILIKPTLLADFSESEDLREYGAGHPSFPQETTADQFFDEAQFESYRELGYQTARRAFTSVPRTRLPSRARA